MNTVLLKIIYESCGQSKYGTPQNAQINNWKKKNTVNVKYDKDWKWPKLVKLGVLPGICFSIDCNKIRIEASSSLTLGYLL